MTSTVNGHRPDVTVGGDVRVCVRASETPSEVGSGADSSQGSAYTRAISQEPDTRPPSTRTKIGDFVSLHTESAKSAAWSSWFGRERPQALYDVCRDVVPGDGFTGNWLALTAATFAGILRLGGLSAAYLAAFCYATRIRAAVSTAVLLAGIGIRSFAP